MARAQAFTLEGFAAAVLLLSSVLFALQMTAVTPLTASTSSQHIENQEAGIAAGVLTAATENESLRKTVLYWNESEGRFADAGSEGYYTSDVPPTDFGTLLARTFSGRNVAYNVNVRYVTTTGQPRTEKLVHRGVPSDNAVRAARTVTLYDDDVLYNATGRTDVAVSASRTYFARDVAPDSPVYNVVEVEVVVWRM